MTSIADLDFMVERLEDEDTGLDMIRVTFEKSGGRGRGELVAKRSLLDDAKTMRADLVDRGALLDGIEREALQSHLLAKLPDSAGKLFTTGGWKTINGERLFVVGNSIIGTPAGIPCGTLPAEPVFAGSVAGTLEGWRDKAAVPALRSSIASVALLASFAAPLREMSSLRESFILNWAGPSSAGKSTCNILAASVWGNPDPAGLPQWGSSTRTLAELGAAFNDLPLILDDTDQSSEVPQAERNRKLFDAVDSLAAGRSRAVSKAMQSQFRNLSFRCIGLSSSQETIEAYARRLSLGRNDGHRTRLLEVRVPHGDEGGIWKSAGMMKDQGADASDDLFGVVLVNHGSAGRAWIEYLLNNQATIEATSERLTGNFMRRVDAEAGGVRRRMLQKAALLYVAGKLATRAGILPLVKRQAFEIARFAYSEFLACAFGQPDDVDKALGRLAMALQDPTWLHHTVHLRAVPADPAPSGILQGDSRLFIRNEHFASIIADGPSDSRLVRLVKANLLDSKAMLSGQGGKRVVTLRLGPKSEERRYLPFDFDRLRTILQTASHN